MVEDDDGGCGVTAIRVAREDRRPCFSPKTLAEYLEVSERTIRALIADDGKHPPKLPSVRVGGVRRILAEDVDAYVAKHRTGRA